MHHFLPQFKKILSTKGTESSHSHDASVPTLRGLFSRAPLLETFLITQVCATRQSYTRTPAWAPACLGVWCCERKSVCLGLSPSFRAPLFLTTESLPGPSALHIDNHLNSKFFFQRTNIKDLGLCCKANLKRLGCCSERHLLLMMKLMYSVQEALGCILVSNSDEHVQVVSRRRCFAYQQGEDSTARKNQAECAFQMPLTDGFYL